jgi:hypothetical protein
VTNTQIKVLVGLVVVIWVVVLLVQGHPVPIDYLKAFPYAVTGASFSLLLWERWLWSWRIFRPWLTGNTTHQLQSPGRGEFVQELGPFDALCLFSKGHLPFGKYSVFLISIFADMEYRAANILSFSREGQRPAITPGFLWE